MSQTLAKWMTLFLVVTIMFTPILYYLDTLHRKAVDAVLQQGLKEASIVGYMSDEIVDKMVNTLVNDYNFDEDVIDIAGTILYTQRKDYIEITITVPRTPVFILNIFNQGSKKLVRKSMIMSEYVG
ncbi:hypothetical protein [Peribacillus loiseleuriae]|uniref:hypothetical protein n=1 Tax=Peribacillus loiseleuriae TaxID=1679170 RepID=UPI003D045118